MQPFEQRKHVAHPFLLVIQGKVEAYSMVHIHQGL